MQTFEYRGYDAAGRPKRGLIEALSVKEAREKLAAEGTLAERLTAAGRRLRFAAVQRATVYRELSALLGAGVPLVRAFENLVQSPETGNLRPLLAGVRDRVREGASLAEAFRDASGSVTLFETAVIQAAERSAAVESTLERLASFLEEQERVRARIEGALLYPLIVFTVGVCVAVLMLGLLVPRAKELLDAGNVPLPAITRFMIGMGSALLWFGPAVAAAAVGGAFVLRGRLRRDADLAVRWDRRLFALPVWGRGYTILAELRFTRTLDLLLRGGVSLIEGLALAGRATGSPWVARLAEQEADAVRHGSPLSDAVRRIPPLAVSLPGWIQVGEASGGLERLLESAGRRTQDQWERYVARCLALLGPALILVVAGFVLLVALSVLLPVISLTQTMGR
jgi:general secretion pathway protein F